MTNPDDEMGHEDIALGPQGHNLDVAHLGHNLVRDNCVNQHQLPLSTQRCQCEHVKHWGQGNAHEYQAVDSTVAFQTAWGTWHVCTDCAATCLVNYPSGDGDI